MNDNSANDTRTDNKDFLSWNNPNKTNFFFEEKEKIEEFFNYINTNIKLEKNEDFENFKSFTNTQ